MRIKNGAPPEYVHADHLGTAVAATGATGARLWTQRYGAFGTRRNPAAANNDNTGFTGHLEDAASGLVYMQARYYEPTDGADAVACPPRLLCA